MLICCPYINTYAICKALAPSTLARSYLVIYGVVIRLDGSTAKDVSAVGNTSIRPSF